MLRTTPFHPRTSPLCQAQNWRRWSGYLAAGSYELMHDREYWAIRSAAALFDVSPLHKYHITGPDASKLLNRMVTRNVAKCRVGQVMYTPWCDEEGKMIDDGTVQHLGESFFRLTSAEPNLRWILACAVGLSVEVEDVSDAVAALSLQGPTSRDILKSCTDLPMDTIKFFRLASGKLAGIPVTVSRTGYSGDLGYEIWMRPDDAIAVWDVLVTAGTPFGLTPAGILALDVARVEAGLILLDVDYVSAHTATIESRKSSPYEVGLGWTVALDKGDFIGRSALAEEFRRGPAWQLMGLDVEWGPLEQLYRDVALPPQLPTITWRVSVPVYCDGRQVGYATSGVWSQMLKKYIALAHLESRYAALGTRVTMEVTVEHKRKETPAHVAKTPFFDPPRKRL